MVRIKAVLSDHSQKDQKWVFKTNYRLMQVKSIAECFTLSILQYFVEHSAILLTCTELPHGFKTFFVYF